MPKFKNYSKETSALKKARNLFIKYNISESEEDTDSEASEEYSHIPLKDQLPTLSLLSLTPVEIETHDMDQITAQLSAIMECVKGIQSHQQQQDQQINHLTNQVDAASAGGSSDIQRPQPASTGAFENLFRIPDPIKGLQTYDGNRKQLSAWLVTAKDTLDELQPHVTANQYKMYVRAVLNKIEGKAKDILCLAGNPQDFEDVAEILTNAIGDRQELSTYMCQMWQNRMNETTSVHKYYQRTKDFVQNMKNLSKQNPIYKDSWNAINTFINEFALAAFISGLREPYFGHVQAARPKDIEDAYAFLCKFKSTQLTTSRTEIAEKRFPTNNKFKSQNNSQTKQFEETPKEKPFNSPKRTQNTTASENMELDPSQKSRLTLRRNYLNNNECDPESSDSQSDDEDVVAINFSLVRNQEAET